MLVAEGPVGDVVQRADDGEAVGPRRQPRQVLAEADAGQRGGGGSVLAADRLERKRAALSCFQSQQAVIAWFAPEVEHYRAAPAYDFHASPGAALYDLWNWPINSRTWQAQAAAALLERHCLRSKQAR